jgi:hypothetical protein
MISGSLRVCRFTISLAVANRTKDEHSKAVLLARLAFHTFLDLMLLQLQRALKILFLVTLLVSFLRKERLALSVSQLVQPKIAASHII